MLADDYRQIEWFKVNALTGGTTYMPTGLGLRPWYCIPAILHLDIQLNIRAACSAVLDSHFVVLETVHRWQKI